MKVLIITPAHTGGTPEQGSVLARRLMTEGMDVSVLSHARTGLGRLMDILLRGLPCVMRHDAVVVNMYGGRAFVYESLATLYARLAGRHIVAVLRAGNMPEFVQRWPRWCRAVLSSVDHILTPHGFLEAELTRLGYRVDGIMPNFIELDRYPFRVRENPRPSLLYVRGMHTYYNPQMAVRVLAMVQARRPEASLTLTGKEGAESQACRDMVHRLGLRNVRFEGLVSKDRLIQLAAEHDIHLNTNLVENMPVSIIEMWASGVPIVATRVGGTPYLVRDGEDGLLVEPDDHEAMSRAVFDLLEKPGMAGALSKRGRSRAEAFDWSRVRDHWLAVLGSCS